MDPGKEERIVDWAIYSRYGMGPGLLSQVVGLGGSSPPPQFLSEQLTLSQPGGQIMPTTVLQAPPKFSDLATALV